MRSFCQRHDHLFSANEVEETVLGMAALAGTVAEEDGRSSDPEVAVGDGHPLPVPRIEVPADGVSGGHERGAVRMHTEKTGGEINRNEAAAREVEAAHIAAELVPADDG